MEEQDNNNKQSKEFYPPAKLSKLSLAYGKLLVFGFLTLGLLGFFLILKFRRKDHSLSKLQVNVRKIWSKIGLKFCGLDIEIIGKESIKADVFVANHISWLDILTLQSHLNVVFIAKSEVKTWAIFGLLARSANTVFVDRRMMAAKAQESQLITCLKKKNRMCFFPEGTSTDGFSVLPFKSTLFEAFTKFSKEDGSDCWVQPITIFYKASNNDFSRLYGWWGDMNLIASIINVVAFSRASKVTLTFHEPINASEIRDRKLLSDKSEEAIRKGHLVQLERVNSLDI